MNAPTASTPCAARTAPACSPANHPANPAGHGTLRCPACNITHGRCIDAVYPLLHQAKVSGERKYLAAGIAVFEWEKRAGALMDR